MLEWILSQGWTVDFTAASRTEEGYIEFRRRGETFWRRSIREAYEYLEGPA